MNRISITIASLLAIAAPATAAAPSVEGNWANPKRSVVVKVAACGSAYCGTVVKASDKAQAKARAGGTSNLVGTRILNNLKPAGKGTFKGQGFDPKHNIRAPATIRLLGPNALEVRGCAVIGILCKEQRWTRVS
ncbi:MAG: DUF2147 domain-containing protein [Pseudomonadota bacterium]|nr:DUF2147 domain-containing protein [Pseudomonadota bacterium]